MDKVFAICSGSWDAIARLWDAATGAALQALEGYSELVTSVAFSPDSKVVRTLFVSDNWVLDGKEKFLWLPPNYRATSIACLEQNYYIRTLIRENFVSRI